MRLLPRWLDQVALIPIREDQADACIALAERLEAEDIRVDAKIAPTHMNKRIKEAQTHQVPFMLIVGEREVEEGTVAVRRRGTREQEVVPFEQFLQMVVRLRDERSELLQ